MADGQGDWQKVCDFDDIPDGQARGFDPFGQGRVTMFAVRRSGHVRAFRDLCPHFGSTSLAWKRDAYLAADGYHIECATHGALFRPEDGLCISGACLGQSLAAVPVRVSAGVVWIARDQQKRFDTVLAPTV